MKPTFLTPEKVAELLGISRQTLSHWRHQGKGPAFVKFGRKVVRYPVEDLALYIGRPIAVEEN